MPMHLCALALVLVVGSLPGADDDALIDAASPGQPRLADGVERDGARLRVGIHVATGGADGDAVEATIGGAAAKRIVRAAEDGTWTRCSTTAASRRPATRT